MDRIAGGQIVEIGGIELALLAGVIHHVAFQYPIQKPLFTAVGGFAVIQSAGVAALLFLNKLQLLTFLTFAGGYVLPALYRIDTRLELSWRSKSHTTFSFVIGVFRANGGFVRAIGGFGSCITATDHTSRSAKCMIRWVQIGLSLH
jgi:hypothetical protein